MPSPRPVFVHIGLQKTGTSYLQSIFWQSQAELTRQGLDMVPGSKRDTFHLMLCVRDRYNPEFDPPEVAEALDRLPAALAAAKGSRALISEECLAVATHDQIKSLLAACAGREVHVIVTLRDLGRQIPSAWQQLLQSGGSVKFNAYLRRLQKTEHRHRAKYWVEKNVIEILDRWAEHVPESRIHLVTVPPPGSDPDALLERFGQVVGIDVSRLNREVGRLNKSIGRNQAEVLSLVNSHLDKVNRRRNVYGEVGKRYFAVKVLGAQPGERILVPDQYRDWVHQVSERHVRRIEAGNFQVVGDLQDLVSVDATFASGSVRPADGDLVDVATIALAQMLDERMENQRNRRTVEPTVVSVKKAALPAQAPWLGARKATKWLGIARLAALLWCPIQIKFSLTGVRR